MTQSIDDLLERLDARKTLEYHSETEDGFSLYSDSSGIHDKDTFEAAAVIRELIADNAKLEALLEKAREGLLPLVVEFNVRKNLSISMDIEQWFIGPNGLTLGDLKKANSVLTAIQLSQSAK